MLQAVANFLKGHNGFGHSRDRTARRPWPAGGTRAPAPLRYSRCRHPSRRPTRGGRIRRCALNGGRAGRGPETPPRPTPDHGSVNRQCHRTMQIEPVVVEPDDGHAPAQPRSIDVVEPGEQIAGDVDEAPDAVAVAAATPNTGDCRGAQSGSCKRLRQAPPREPSPGAGIERSRKTPRAVLCIPGCSK